MSQIGIEQNYVGNKYSLYCTNLNVNSLINLGSNKLPENSIIISSPISNGADNGNPSILMTDVNGDILPLTYTLNTSNFEYNNNNNTVSLNSSILEKINYAYTMAVKYKNSYSGLY